MYCGKIKFAPNAVSDVWQNDAEVVKNCYMSNTASFEENPSGSHKVACYVKDVKNTVFDFGGATLMIHGILTPLLFDGCENITLKNLTVDYRRPTMSEFYVESENGGEYTIVASEDTLFAINGNELKLVGESFDGAPLWSYPYKGKNMLAMYTDGCEKTEFMPREKGDTFPSFPEIDKIISVDGRKIVLTLKNKNAESALPVGSTVQIRNVVRNEVGGFFTKCKNLRLENVTVRAMHGLGLLFQNCENVSLINLDCTPKEGRTIASNADFFHFSGCRGKIRLNGCKARGAHDDFINVHGTYLQVVDTDKSNNAITVKFMHPQSFGFTAFAKRDKVVFIRRDTLEKCGTATVKSIKVLSLYEIWLTLSSLPDFVSSEYAVENLSATPSLDVHNCFFGHSMGRGILASTPKKVNISGNVFDRVEGTLLLLGADCGLWYESGATKNVVFSNNSVNHCSRGADGKGRAYITVKSEKKQVGDKFFQNKLTVKGNAFTGTPPEATVFDLNDIEKVILLKNSFDFSPRVRAERVGKIVKDFG